VLNFFEKVKEKEATKAELSHSKWSKEGDIFNYSKTTGNPL